MKQFLIITACLLTLITISCKKGDDPHASILLDKAHQAGMDGNYQEATKLLEEVINTYPGTSAANIAAEEYDTFKNFARSEKENRTKLVVSLVKKCARAVELYKHKKNFYPRTLDDLIPDFLPNRVIDSWGNPILYKRTTGNYIIACYGQDGVPGGDGNDQDILLQDGKIVTSFEL